MEVSRILQFLSGMALSRSNTCEEFFLQDQTLTALWRLDPWISFVLVVIVKIKEINQDKILTPRFSAEWKIRPVLNHGLLFSALSYTTMPYWVRVLLLSAHHFSYFIRVNDLSWVHLHFSNHVHHYNYICINLFITILHMYVSELISLQIFIAMLLCWFIL